MNDAEREALERRIDELCQEVEQLRKQLHDQQDTAEHNFVRNAREYKRVCDENAKLVVKLNAEHIVRQNVEIENDRLREQVDYMTPIALYEASERERDRMRELGIEVDG